MSAPDEVSSMLADKMAFDIKHLRGALRAIQKGLTEDADSEFWSARRWLDERGIFHGDVSGYRVLDLVAREALRRTARPR